MYVTSAPPQQHAVVETQAADFSVSKATLPLTYSVILVENITTEWFEKKGAAFQNVDRNWPKQNLASWLLLKSYAEKKTMSK